MCYNSVSLGTENGDKRKKSFRGFRVSPKWSLISV